MTLSDCRGSAAVGQAMARRLKQTLALVIALLILAAVGRFLEPPSPQAREDTKTILSLVAAGSQGYHIEYQRWPKTLADLTRNPEHIQFMKWERWGEGNDAWGHPLLYRPFDESLGYGSVTSYGEDGRTGGAATNDDLQVRFNERHVIGP